MSSATSLPVKRMNKDIEEKDLPLKELNVEKSSSGSGILKRKYDSHIGQSLKPAKCMKSSIKPFTVSIEGNIGSGKSTFLKYFSSVPGVETFQEPISKWTNLGGFNLLHKLYENPNRWSFLFQSYVQLTRLDIHLSESDHPVKLIERSFHNNRFCFLEDGLRHGDLKEEEFAVLTEYFDFFEKHFDIDVDLIVYLRTCPEVVFERMRERGRSEEANVSLEYLQRIHNAYEKWLLTGRSRSSLSKIIVIDGNKDLKSIFAEYEKKKKYILGKCVLEETI